MSIRIVDNKKIEMTNDEFALFQEICKSYTSKNFDGEDLFKELFEADDAGRIIFLRPPKTYTSMEVFMFLVSLMVHQHLGAAIKDNINAMNDMKQLMQECRELMKEIKAKT